MGTGDVSEGLEQEAAERLRLLELIASNANDAILLTEAEPVDDASSNGIVIADPNLPDNPSIYVNPKFEEITDYKAEEAIGLNCRFLAREERDPPALNELRITIAEGREWSGPLRNYLKDGTVFWNELYIDPVRDKVGRITHFIGVQKDITERKVLEERLVHEAFHDALTDLPNRAMFLDRLGRALTRAGRREETVAVLFMDLDNFKAINDSLGHPAGNRLLLAVSERLSNCLRPSDTAARLGGDEFAILLEDISDSGEAKRVAKRITEVLEEPFYFGRCCRPAFTSGKGPAERIARAGQQGILERRPRRPVRLRPRRITKRSETRRTSWRCSPPTQPFSR